MSTRKFPGRRSASTNGLEDLGGVLQRVLRKGGLQEDLELIRLLQDWEIVVGKQVATQAKLKDVQKGILYIECPQAAWRQEIYFHKTAVIAAANARLGACLIQEIRFV